MLDTEWKIAKGAGRCAVCTSEFAVGAEIFSALLQTAAGLQRQDYCAACFQSQPKPEGLYYFWKNSPSKSETAAPSRARPALDVDFVLEFFTRLEGETDSQKLAFRYILALMLARKKVLVPVKGAPDLIENGLRVGQWKEKGSGKDVRVVEPELNPEELHAISGELAVLLGLPQSAAPAGSEPPESGQPVNGSEGGDGGA